MIQKLLPWWPALAWATLIFISSSSVLTTAQLANGVNHVSAGVISDGGFRQFWSAIWWLFVKGWHATEFALLYLLTLRAIKLNPNLALIPPAIYAVLDEFHQLFVPHRGCRASDVCIDWVGILAVWAFIRFRPKLPIALLTALATVGAIYLLSTYSFGLIELPAYKSDNAFQP